MSDIQLTKEHIESLKQAFEKADTDKNGVLSRDELAHLIKADPFFGDFSERMIQRIVDKSFTKADINGDGSISFEEFVKAQHLHRSE